jgi:hypothetical protein
MTLPSRPYQHGGLATAILCVLIAGSVLLYDGWQRDVHRPVSIADVDGVTFHRLLTPDGSITTPEEYAGRRATAAEAAQVVAWFNSAKDIRPNREFAGEPASAAIRISLKSGRRVSIGYPGGDLAVQRNDVRLGGRTVAYWARQPDIRRLLEQLLKTSGR